ncbi:hypothetical protein N599_09945 [Saccharopolyspora erythraea D]|nr:hypothetical protein N599_09945 [Saccharopolyspora erythraea D]
MLVLRRREGPWPDGVLHRGLLRRRVPDGRLLGRRRNGTAVR